MSSLNKASCVQCGLPCRDDARVYKSQNFCCSGCETVYRIINEEQTDPALLCDLDFPQPANHDALSYLDDEEIRNQLLTFQSSDLSIVRLYIPRIHCSSCIWLLENLHQLQDGILSVKVQFLRREATIRFNPQTTDLKKLVALLTSLGYTPDLSKNSNAAKKHTNRTLLLQLGVAGFCFGNMMLLSFPEYLNGSENISPQFRHFFAYISIVLSLPVLLYSARGFFSRAWAGLRHKQVTLDVPLSLGMIMFYLRSLYDILTHTGMGFMDSFAGLVFFLLIGRWLQQRTFDALTFERDYRSFFPISVSRLSENGTESIPLFRLKRGDHIRVLQNELIPADAVILEGKAHIDYSFVTGEDAPQSPVAGEKIYAGGRQLGSALTLQIVKDVSQSYLTQLWNEQPFRENRSSLTNFADRISGTFTIAILSIATLAALYWIPQDVSLALNVFSAVLIISCPCALALSSPFALGQAQQVFGRNGLFLKNPAVVEALASIRHIVFDKTGTLTGTGSAKVQYQRLRGEAADQAVSLAVSLAGLSTHPISRSISLLESQNHYPISAFQEFSGKGISGIWKNHHIKLGSASFVNADETCPAASTYLSLDDEVIGYFHVKPAYRSGIEKMVGLLKQKVSLLSGDNDLARSEIRRLLGNQAKLHFNQSPIDKLEKITEIQKAEPVLMLGDGLNDAGALKESRCGIAVANDIHGFVPACDGILQADELYRLPNFLKLAANTLSLIKVNLGISLIYNIIGISFAVQGLLSPLICAILMPLSSISVIACAAGGVQLIARKAQLTSPKKTLFENSTEQISPYPIADGVAA